MPGFPFSPLVALSNPLFPVNYLITVSASHSISSYWAKFWVGDTKMKDTTYPCGQFTPCGTHHHHSLYHHHCHHHHHHLHYRYRINEPTWNCLNAWNTPRAPQTVLEVKLLKNIREPLSCQSTSPLLQCPLGWKQTGQGCLLSGR